MTPTSQICVTVICRWVNRDVHKHLEQTVYRVNGRRAGIKVAEELVTSDTKTIRDDEGNWVR